MLDNIENKGSRVSFFEVETRVRLSKNAKNGSTDSVGQIFQESQSLRVSPRGFSDTQNQSYSEEEENEPVSYNKVVYKSYPTLSDEFMKN